MIEKRIKKIIDTFFEGSQSKASEELGLGVSLLSTYMLGKRKPSIDSLEKFVQYGFNGNWLLTGEGNILLEKDTGAELFYLQPSAIDVLKELYLFQQVFNREISIADNFDHFKYYFGITDSEQFKQYGINRFALLNIEKFDLKPDIEYLAKFIKEKTNPLKLDQDRRIFEQNTFHLVIKQNNKYYLAYFELSYGFASFDVRFIFKKGYSFSGSLTSIDLSEKFKDIEVFGIIKNVLNFDLTSNAYDFFPVPNKEKGRPGIVLRE